MCITIIIMIVFFLKILYNGHPAIIIIIIMVLFIPSVVCSKEKNQRKHMKSNSKSPKIFVAHAKTILITKQSNIDPLSE